MMTFLTTQSEMLKKSRLGRGITQRLSMRKLTGIKLFSGIVIALYLVKLLSRNTPMVLDNRNGSSNELKLKHVDEYLHIAVDRKDNGTAGSVEDTKAIPTRSHDNNNSVMDLASKQEQEPNTIKQYPSRYTAEVTTTFNKRTPHLWIDAVTYAEGIAGWKTSLLELLFFANKVDCSATVVEPCMTNGRLRSCGRSRQKGIPVSEVFDLEEYMTSSESYSSSENGMAYPLLVSYDDYQKAIGNTNASMEKVCMLHDKQHLSIEKRCTKDASWIMNMRQNHLQRKMEESNQKHFILHMENYWRGQVYELGWQLGMYIPGDKKKRFIKGMKIPKRHVFESKTIPFHPKHMQLVDDLLESANITVNNFSTIHWRAEKKGMDFMRCARAIKKVKRIMLNEMKRPATANVTRDEHKFVLMSSLNEDVDMMWSGSRKTANQTFSSQQALQYLLRDQGFIKVDGLLKTQAKENVHSHPGMLAIYDLIIATKAYNFATCARDGRAGCNKATRQLCEACNHVGKFGRLATSLRKENVDRRGLSTWECWPSE